MNATTLLPISIYCVWQWWEQHYQAAQGRPDYIDFNWLDETYLGRQRQLNAWFEDIGIGHPSPILDTSFVSMLLPYHTMIVPVILGMPATLQDVGGYQNHPLNEKQLANLKPVDLAHSPVRRHGREPGFSFIPITWEELDWEFSRYHSTEGGQL